MKKIILGFTMAAFLLSGCFITNIFRKKERVGCPTDGRNVGAEKLLGGDEKAAKKASKAKWKGGR